MASKPDGPIFDLVLRFLVQESDSLYGLDVNTNAWVLQRTSSGRYEWFAGKVKNMNEERDEVSVELEDDRGKEIVRVPRSRVCRQLTPGTDVEVLANPSSRQFVPAKITAVNDQDCVYSVEIVGGKSGSSRSLSNIPREHIRLPLPLRSRVKYHAPGHDRLTDGVVVHYDSSRLEYEVRPDASGAEVGMGSVVTPKTRSTGGAVTVPPQDILACLPTRVVKGLRAASSGDDVFTPAQCERVFGQLGAPLSSEDLKALQSVGADGDGLSMDKILDVMLVSDSDFGVPVRMPDSARKSSNRRLTSSRDDTESTSANVRSTTSSDKNTGGVSESKSNLMSDEKPPLPKKLLKTTSAKSTHAKSVSIDMTGTKEGSRVVTFDPTLHATSFIPQPLRSALIQACKAGSSNVFGALDPDGNGTAPIDGVVSALCKACPDAKPEDIRAVCRCFDVKGDGEVKYRWLVDAFGPDVSSDFKELMEQLLRVVLSKPSPVTAVNDLKEAFTSADADMNGYLTKAEVRRVLRTALDFGTNADELALWVKAFPYRGESAPPDVIDYLAFVSALCLGVKGFLRRVHNAFTTKGMDLLKSFQYREAQLQGNRGGDGPITSVPKSSLRGTLPLEHFLTCVLTIGIPLTRVQLYTLACCAVVPATDSAGGAGGDVAVDSTSQCSVSYRCVVEVARGKLPLQPRLAEELKADDNEEDGGDVTHGKSKSEFYPVRFKSERFPSRTSSVGDELTSRHVPQPSTLSHNPLETDVVAPVDSGVMYVDFDDIVTNEDVIDKCERSLSDQRASRGRGRSDASDVDDRDMLDDRVKRDVGKWDLDDMFQPCREYCEERKTGRVTTTVDETDSDSDWEEDGARECRISTSTLAPPKRDQARHSQSFRAWRGMVGALFHSSTTDGSTVSLKTQLPAMLTSLGLELQSPALDAILKQESFPTDRVTLSAFVRIVRRAAKLKRSMGLSLLSESRIRRVLTTNREGNSPLCPATIISRRVLFGCLISPALGCDLTVDEATEIAVVAPGPNVALQYGIDVTPETLDPEWFLDVPEVSVDAFVDWLFAFSTGVYVPGCDSYFVRHGLRKLCSGFMEFPIQSTDVCVKWCKERGFDRADEVVTPTPPGGAGGAAKIVDALVFCGPVLCYTELMDIVPPTFRLSMLAIAYSHPSQSLSSALLPKIEPDPACIVNRTTSTSITTSPTTSPPMTPGPGSGQVIGTTAQLTTATTSTQGPGSLLSIGVSATDGQSLVTMAPGVDGVGASLRYTDLLPGFGWGEVGCTGGSTVPPGTDPFALRSISSGQVNGDVLTGGRIRPIVQSVVTLLASHGVPSITDAARMHDRVHSRHVRVTLVDKIMHPKADGSFVLRVLTNQHVIPARWDAREEDKWAFPNTDQDSGKFIVRTDHPRCRCGLQCLKESCLQHLHLLIEFTTTLRRNATQVLTPVPVTAEYTTAWGLLPIAQVTNLQSSTRVTLPMFGGSPLFSQVILPEKTLQRRTGWRSIPKQLKGVVPCEVMLSVAPVTALPNSLSCHVGYLPFNIITPVSCMGLMGMFRACVADGLRLSKDGVPQTTVGAHGFDASEALFQRIVADTHAMTALKLCWAKTLKTVARNASHTDVRRVFRDTVSRLLPDVVCLQPTPDAHTRKYTELVGIDPRAFLSPRVMDDNVVVAPFDVKQFVLKV